MFTHDSSVSSRGLHSAVRPSAIQERLLEVVFKEPKDAAATWRAIASSFDLDQVERGTFEVLPLVYRSLVRADVDDPVLPRLKGIYRKAWATNSLLAGRTTEAARALGDADIPALFVEGVVLAQRFYPELGLRPTSSIDVLVRHRDGNRARAALARAGWRSGLSGSRRHAQIDYLVDPHGNTLVLRTSLATDFVVANGDATDPLWSGAEPWSLGDVDVLVPSSTATLLAVCASHARPDEARRTQWILDAAMVLGSTIDWEELLVVAAASGQSPRLRDVLLYLDSLQVPTAPEDVLRALERAGLSHRQRWTYALTARPFGRLGALPSLAAEHLAATTGESWFRTLSTFPRHLRDHWALPTSWLVPLAAVRRAGALLIRRPTRGA